MRREWCIADIYVISCNITIPKKRICGEELSFIFFSGKEMKNRGKGVAKIVTAELVKVWYLPYISIMQKITKFNESELIVNKMAEKAGAY